MSRHARYIHRQAYAPIHRTPRERWLRQWSRDFERAFRPLSAWAQAIIDAWEGMPQPCA